MVRTWRVVSLAGLGIAGLMAGAAQAAEDTELSLMASYPAEQCGRNLRPSECRIVPDPQQGAACVKRCVDLVWERMAELRDEEELRCETEFAAHEGKGAHVCTLVDEGPVETQKAAKAKFVDAMQGKGDLDQTFQVLVRATLSVMQKPCTEECRKGGRERMRAAGNSFELVKVYKRCMVAADSTMLARRYHAYDDTLYRDLLSKADARCRGVARCDWVERYSDHECSYGD